ncbi:MAG: imidazole glycerol phosphate synthase subunit HisH [Thermoproteus sp.]
MKVAILDYTVGNIGSLISALRRAGAEAFISRGEGLGEADAVILPGVGTFSAASRLAAVVKGYAGSKPMLGICLGMQLLFDSSEEGEGQGLSFFPGRVVRIDAERIPHIGWELTSAAGTCGLVDRGYYYYLHSYGVEAGGAPYEAAYIELRRRYVAAVCDEGRGIYGVQFHPERSGRRGLEVLRRFLKLART